jgi:uncharacterized repeat protein (TIGR03806 family)
MPPAYSFLLGIVTLTLVTGCGSSSAPGAPDAGTVSRDAGPVQPLPDATASEAAAAADAYVITGPGPFGLERRPDGQTCKPPAREDQPAATLRSTGCVDPADPRRPAASLIPYDVLSPLWSDGADKQRFMALPDGALIHVKDCTREPATCKPKEEGGTTEDEGHWVLPVGTVLMKSFLFGGKLLETRLFVRMSADQWVGYSYRWNAEQTDATLVAATGLNDTIAGADGKMQSWYFPSRRDCFECHNKTVGSSLGLETRQLDRPLTYPSGTTANQLATLEHIGVLDAPVARQPPLADYRTQDAESTPERRARSYLHSNCGICHRPYGTYSDIDLRVGTPLAMMNVCDIDQNKGNVGVVGARRLIPGAPDRSVIVLRMKALDDSRMPQLATSVLDPIGIPVVSDWIKSLAGCP